MRAFLVGLWLGLFLLASVAQARDESPAYRVAPVAAWVIDPIKFTPKSKADGREALHWWLADARAGFVDGDVKQYLHWAVSVDSADGVSQMAQQEISFQPDYQQVILHRLGLWRDGRWSDRLERTEITVANRESQFEQGMAAGLRSLLLVVPDVRVGDLVEISYSIEGSNPVLAGVRGGSLHLAATSSVERHRVEVVRDRGRPMHLAVLGKTALTLPQWTEAGAYQRLVIEQRQTPALQLVDAVPPEFVWMPMLEYSEASGWPAVVAWAQDLFQSRADDPAVARVLGDLRADGDEQAQILAALRFVQQDVRYFAQLLGDNSHRPHSVSEILDKRLGDCKDKSLLLVSLLRGLGFDAYPALYSNESQAAVITALPRGTVFDHAIVMLEHEGKRYWLDPTIPSQSGRLNELGFYSHGAALIVRAGETTPVPTKAVSELPAVVALTEQLQVGADGRGDLSVRFEYGREMAEYQRSRISAVGQRQMDQIHRDYYTRRFGPLEMADSPRWDLDRPGNGVSVEQHYRLSAPTRNGGDGSAVRIENSGLADMFQPPSVVDREAPMAQFHPLELRYRFELQLAEGMRLSSQPEALTIDAPGFHFEQAVQQDGDTWVLTQIARSQSRNIAAGDVRAYAQAVDRARQHAGMQLKLSGARTDDDERRERLRKMLQGE
ncbi:MAG: DUF3857 domain-containing protein [Lysobacterales bacterium]